MFAERELIKETPRLSRFALHLTRNKADAEDLVQATCLRALEKAHYYADGSNLFSWTSKIMFNLFVTEYRQRRRFEPEHDPENLPAGLITGPTQDTKVELASIKRIIMRLSREHQQVLDLVCAQGLQYEEVAKKLGIATGTVRSRLSRAREHIRTEVGVAL